MTLIQLGSKVINTKFSSIVSNSRDPPIFSILCVAVGQVFFYVWFKFVLRLPWVMEIQYSMLY